MFISLQLTYPLNMSVTEILQGLFHFNRYFKLNTAIKNTENVKSNKYYHELKPRAYIHPARSQNINDSTADI